MKKIILAFTILFTSFSWSQQSPEENNSQTKIVKKDTIVIDSIPSGILMDDTNDFSQINGLFSRGKEKISLLDNPVASRIDSLWKQEILKSNLFDTIYKEVQNLPYDDSIAFAELPTDTLKARLARLNQRTPFNIEYNPSLESVIKSFLKRRRTSLQKLMDKSDYYFPMFEQELDVHDIPLEVKYLAIVESALNPRARSRVGATGLWQFMFSTGRMYKLDVNSYVDERMDPLKSTAAAARYLAKLYEIFEDWDLALAAYNSGPGNVSKAIRRSGGYKNYWNLRPYLPRETAGYVPAFLATMYIFEYAEEHGFKRTKNPVPYFETDTVSVKKMIGFDHISELTGIEKEQVAFLNPAYKLDIIPVVDGKDYSLRLSTEAIGRFVANEDSIYAYVTSELAKREKPLPQLVKVDAKIRYRVRSGDFLGKIANRYGVRVRDIKRWNGLRSNNLRIGQRLTIYPRKPNFKAPKTSKKQTVAPKKLNSKNANLKLYTVQSGDSLWTIAQKFSGVSVENLKNWNGISGTKLKPGMRLKLCNC
ncbi:lytic transglycosylase domain-containing protein [Ascidiimonas sp. W6]|uniref:lytic transglycosylase domain-containing protein n=1 Tax=Ascidiimonas meishanensis TaxID=3128903 RepID=UPI0030EBEFBB